MTISNISGAATFSQSGVGMDAEGQLALLILETEDTRHEVASADKLLARDRFVSASNAEVAAMHEEAHDILIGAAFQCAASMTAAAIQVGDALDEPECDSAGNPTEKEKPWGEIGAAASNAMSQPLGKMLGDSPAANDRAEAKQAATTAEQATWKLDDANGAIDKSNKHQDKALDWLASEAANKASTENGIIAGFA
jgi:hypothetical protein